MCKNRPYSLSVPPINPLSVMSTLTHVIILGYNSSHNTSTIRSAACPSHSSGIAPFFHSPAYNLSSAGLTAAGLVPISSLVPTVQVSGRSVLSRSVIQGTPITVVSSVIPPESVTTARLCCTK